MTTAKDQPMPITRTFTPAALAAIGVPPAEAEDVEYSDVLLADEFVATLKYSQQRRVIFRAEDDGHTYAVTYEAELDTGDYEVGGGMPDNHGWYGDTVEAVAVEQRLVTVTSWLPAEADQPGDSDQPAPAWHWGADPSHGGQTRHKGAQENCPAPDCEPEHPAAFLRRAALHGRGITHRIAATAPPPWLSLDGGDRLIHDPGHDRDQPVYVVPEPLDSPEAADHFALMDPAVADAVYVLLETEADVLDDMQRQSPDLTDEQLAAWGHGPLTIAAALLREPAPEVSR